MSTINAGTTAATGLVLTADTTGALELQSAGVTKATVSSTGNVNAVTFTSTQTTGTAPLTVASTTKVSNFNADQLDGLHIGQSGANYILYSDNSGAVLLGTTAANGTDLLQVNGPISITANTTARVWRQFVTSTGHFRVRDAITTNDPLQIEAGAPDSSLWVTSGGNVLMGKQTSTGYKLEVNGTCANTTGSWSTISDERMKIDIKPITGAMDKVEALAGAMAHYRYRDESGIDTGYRTGAIAQRLEAIGFEGHVNTSTEDIMDEKIGALLGWEYDNEKYEDGSETKTRRIVTKKGEPLKSVENNFSPYLFPAFKELLDYTRSLEARLSALEAK